MKRKLMEYLACAMCKSHPLDLHVFDEKDEIVEGLLVCPNNKCRMWYPIMEEIPHCLPPELRNEKEDKDFLRKWKDKIPAEVLEKGEPFNLAGE
jgi:uncharacterized protein YbaR (Trm112 family)